MVIRRHGSGGKIRVKLSSSAFPRHFRLTKNNIPGLNGMLISFGLNGMLAIAEGEAPLDPCPCTIL